MRVAKQMKCDKRKSNGRTALLLRGDRRASASRSSANLKAGYRTHAAKNRPEARDAAVDIPMCRFPTNAGGGDCFFLCIEQATGNSVFAKRQT